MAEAGKITVKVDADTAKLDKGLTNTQKKLKSLDNNVRAISGTFSKVFGAAMLGAAAASVKLASDADETRSKLKTVFGEGAQDAVKWAETTAKATNTSKFALESYLSTLQDTFKPLGFAADAAAGMSKEVVALAVDLASFNNLRTEDVVNDLQSALVGNTETLRKYGVVASQAAVDQEALALGLEFTKGKMDAQTKAAAIMSLTLKGTVDAQGDAIKTSEGLANQMKGLGADVTDLAVDVGKALTPAALGLVKVFRTLAAGSKDVFKGMRGAINETIRDMQVFALKYSAFIEKLDPRGRTGKELDAFVAFEIEKIEIAARKGREEINGQKQAWDEVTKSVNATTAATQTQANAISAGPLGTFSTVGADFGSINGGGSSIADDPMLAQLGFTNESLNALILQGEAVASFEADAESARSQEAKNAVDAMAGIKDTALTTGLSVMQSVVDGSATPQSIMTSTLTAMGTAIAGPVGGVIGGLLGSLMGGGGNKETIISNINTVNPGSSNRGDQAKDQDTVLEQAEKVAQNYGNKFANAIQKDSLTGQQAISLIRGMDETIFLAKEQLSGEALEVFMSNLTKSIDKSGQSLEEIRRRVENQTGVDTKELSFSEEFQNTPRRAHGGPVTAGKPYIVGENQPELFVPSQSGTIMPSVPGGDITINVIGATNPEETAQRTKIALEKLLRTGEYQNLQARAA